MKAPGGKENDPALLPSALALAARGWLVFPCVPGGKKPALRGNWQNLATTDPDRVRAWWGRAPYNIGIACGPSGLVVLDLDVPSGEQPGSPAADAVNGSGVLADLCDQHRQPYPLPTYVVDTPSGGCHLYYTAPAKPVRNSAARLGPLIDVRADGGYVVGAGSRAGDRAYRARDGRTLVLLPAWIRDLLESAPLVPALRWAAPVPSGAQGTAYAMAALREESRLVATARPGTRNDTLNRAAFSLGQLAATGLLPPLAVATALASTAERAGLPAGEARRTIRSGMTAGARHPRQTPRSSVPAERRSLRRPVAC